MIQSTGKIHLTSGEMLEVTSDYSMATLAMEDIQRKIEVELDNAYSDWISIQILIVKSNRE